LLFLLASMPPRSERVRAAVRASGDRSPADPSFDQVVLHVEDALPYRSLIARLVALLVGRREERVPALNVNLAPD
jgi:hypothetical protein